MNVRDALGFTFRKRLPRRFGGERILVTPRADVRVLRPGWNGCAYDLMLISDQILGPGMCVWDIGANLGIFSAMAAFKVGKSGAVFALEAAPRYASLIQKTSRLLSSRYVDITTLCGAISDSVGVMDFGVSKRGHARNKLLGVSEDGDFDMDYQMSVISITADKLLEHWRPPDLVKMDVEGAEIRALAGCETLLREVRPVLYLEVAPENQTLAAEMLRSSDYDVFHLKGDGSEEAVERCTLYTVARPRKRLA